MLGPPCTLSALMSVLRPPPQPITNQLLFCKTDAAVCTVRPLQFSASGRHSTPITVPLYTYSASAQLVLWRSFLPIIFGTPAAPSKIRASLTALKPMHHPFLLCIYIHCLLFKAWPQAYKAYQAYLHASQASQAS